MTRRLLVLGGSGFLGRAAVGEGLRAGWEVTTFNRGLTAAADPEVHAVTGDRLDPGSLRQLADRDWDVVVDTWAGAPRAVRESARVLGERVGSYAYISSESVYAWPPPLGVHESAPTVAASPDATDGSYPELKRGAELALEQALPDRSLRARAGLILGPHEDVGRLTWWLARMARGGEILCPGPVDLPIQFVDARDLARFVLDAAAAGRSGPFNVVCRRGHATIGSLLAACHDVAGADGSRLTWVDPETIARAGLEPWTELPVWIPPGDEAEALHHSDVERAHGAGLVCRPVIDTVGDTWRWLSALGAEVPVRGDRPRPGVSPDREQAALLAYRR